MRYDSETALYWMSVRAYDPTLGRFISRDPLGRVPLMGWTSQPYAYAGNNPLVNVDPSGQRFMSDVTGGSTGQAPENPNRPHNHYVFGSLCGAFACGWSHHYDDHLLTVGVGQALYNLALLVGTVLAGKLPVGLGIVVGALTHGALNNMIHGMVSGVEKVWIGIFGPLTIQSKVGFDFANLLGDIASVVVGIIDGVKAFQAAKSFAGSMEKFLVKVKNLFLHGFNKKVFGDLLGDIGNFATGLINSIIDDYENLRLDARTAFGWSLP